MKQYTFSYQFNGSNWSINIWANNPEEAQEKIKSVATAKFDGEVIASLYVPVKAPWLRNIYRWFVGFFGNR